MKEKIINFLKLKTHPEAKFIILGLFYIIAMNVMTLFRIFDLLIFFCIYFCIKHLNTKPTLSKKRMLLSSTIIFIFVLEIWILINYISFICFSPFFYSNIKLELVERIFFLLILMPHTLQTRNKDVKHFLFVNK